MAALAGIGLGAGISVAAHSDGAIVALGAVLVVGALVALSLGVLPRRPVPAAGQRIPVRLDALDRSTPVLGVAPTLITGKAFPYRDTPYLFQTRTALPPEAITEILDDGGRGTLPEAALGSHDARPVLAHRPVGAAPALTVTVVAMWLTIVLVPGHVWNLTVSTSSASSSTSADRAAAPSIADRYAAALAHVRSQAPAELESLLSVEVYTAFARVETYLGGDRMRTYTQQFDGSWESEDERTDSRSKDAFAAGALSLSVESMVTAAAAMLPADLRTPARMEISRGDDPTDTSQQPLLVSTYFTGGDSAIEVQSTPDGTLAQWWSGADLVMGMAQVRNGLGSVGVGPTERRVKDITLNPGGYAGYAIEFYRGDTYFRSRASAGQFLEPVDEITTDDDGPRLAVTDLDPAVLTRVRDDAMARLSIDAVDRDKASITIGPSYAAGQQYRGQFVIDVDFGRVRSTGFYYTLDGTYIGPSD